MAEAPSPNLAGHVTSGSSTTSPKHGTISTATSSMEPTPQQHDPTLNRLAVDMFDKTEKYLQAELELSLDDYRLLTQMNRCTHDKYSEMSALGREVKSALTELNFKYTELQPQLARMDDVEASLAKLEAVTSQLDSYSRQIEARVKVLNSR